MRNLPSPSPRLSNPGPSADSPSIAGSRLPGRTPLAQRLQQLSQDKRGQQKAIPIDLGRYLNELQLLALHSLESFGWQLWFIRRPLFMQPIAVVSNPDSSRHAVLEVDGSINIQSGIQLRT